MLGETIIREHPKFSFTITTRTPLLQLVYMWDERVQPCNFKTRARGSSQRDNIPACNFCWRGQEEQLPIRETRPHPLFQKLICILDHHPKLKSSVCTFIWILKYIFTRCIFSLMSDLLAQIDYAYTIFREQWCDTTCRIALTRRQLSPTTAACVEVEWIASRRL